jgi:hypothetical protein
MNRRNERLQIWLLSQLVNVEKSNNIGPFSPQHNRAKQRVAKMTFAGS